MKNKGFSIAEVMVAAAVLAVGLTAAAMLVGALIRQEEANAASFRASNLQEQAVKLYRLDLKPNDIVNLLPENSTRIALGAVPPVGVYGFSFSRDAKTTLSNAAGNIIVDISSCTMVFAKPGVEGSLATNRVSIVRPSIRVEYEQN
jgi:prepilin-type N-terminal cleavage/methylation domain-containing protein